MAIVTGSWLTDIWLFTIALVLGVYTIYKHQFQYWKKRNVVHTEPSIPFGDMKGANYAKSLGDILKNLYEQFKGQPFFGAWMAFSPTIVLRDPELVKSVFVKDFMSFHDRGPYINEKEDPLAAHLFFIRGTKWRNLRTRLSPTFTSGKMKMMFPILQKCSEELKDLLKEPARKGEIVEMKEIAARFTTDIILLCAFGIETNSLKNPDAEFRQMGRKIFQPTIKQSVKRFILFFVPNLGKFIQVSLIA